MSFAVISENWKLVANRSMNYIELYDLESDPLEAVNVADKQEKEVRRLRTMLKEWRASLPDRPSGKVFSRLRDEGRP